MKLNDEFFTFESIRTPKNRTETDLRLLKAKMTMEGHAETVPLLANAFALARKETE